MLQRYETIRPIIHIDEMYLDNDMQLLYVDVQTETDEEIRLKHCLFNDRTFLTDRTNKAYRIVKDYFNEINQGYGTTLNLSENTTLRLAVSEVERTASTAQLAFTLVIDQTNNYTQHELTTFISRLNQYTNQCIYDIDIENQMKGGRN